ncbi:MAG: hypothetical protein EAZ21_11660 [Betaproteobacteria bacterium]|nr:MAG: hypothetical protein EAZ21_11660 [Betaproteobacteria bacterium]
MYFIASFFSATCLRASQLRDAVFLRGARFALFASFASLASFARRLHRTGIARAAAFSVCAATAWFGPSAANAGPLMMDEPASQVVTGGSANCAAMANGTVRCWGIPLVNSDTPIDMPLVGADVFRIAAGASGSGATACAVKPTSNGSSVKCFQNATAAPIDATEFGADVVDFVMRRQDRCALKSNGKVFCSGSTPTQGEITLPGGEFAAQVSSDITSACARSTIGRVYCWGANNFGQLGNGTTVNSATPVLTVLPTDFVAASVSVSAAHACAASTTGRTMCWGYNYFGSLGNGTTSGTDPNPTPVDVVTLGNGTRDIVVFGFGSDFSTCARVEAGGVKCWGSNFGGTLGDGTTADSAVPVNVTGLSSGVTGLNARSVGICSLGQFGDAKCWGSSGNGALGDSGLTTASYARTPVVVNRSARGATSVAAGNNQSCALTPGGGVKCWGTDSSSISTPTSLPRDVAGATGKISQVSAGSSAACAVTFSGGVKCWGDGIRGALGNNLATSSATAVDVVDGAGLLTNVKQVRATFQAACALLNDNSVRCWGSNNSGNGGGILGVDPAIVGQSNTAYATPVNFNLPEGETIVDLVTSTSPASACVITSAGGLRCWGGNTSGQLGNGSTATAVWQPVTPTGLGSGVSAVALGSSHACALKTDGRVVCWGNNSVGQLGDGTTSATSVTTPPTTPVNFGAGVTATAIAAGGGTSCALLSTGNLACWGNNSAGQLGDGTLTDRSTPVLVNLIGPARPMSVSVSLSHACALMSDAGVQCWGRNNNGQLGNNTTAATQATPVDVLPFGQSIAFIAPPSLKMNVAVPLSATASSGLPVSFDTWTPQTCTVSGNTTTGFTVTATAPVLCGIRALQAGNLSAPAGQFTRAPNAFAIVPITDAECGSANGVRANVAPTANLCASGTASAVVAGDGFEWFCSGAATHAASVCKAPFARLNVDASDPASRYVAGNDGVMLLRYLFGFRGNSLTQNGALIGAGAVRNTAALIEAHIEANLAQFDVDLDGSTLPLTDGVMILRRMLGLDGAALIAGAHRSVIADEAVRISAIRARIEALRP